MAQGSTWSEMKWWKEAVKEEFFAWKISKNGAQEGPKLFFDWKQKWGEAAKQKKTIDMDVLWRWIKKGEQSNQWLKHDMQLSRNRMKKELKIENKKF